MLLCVAPLKMAFGPLKKTLKMQWLYLPTPGGYEDPPRSDFTWSRQCRECQAMRGTPHMSNGLNLLYLRKDVAEMVIVFYVSHIVRGFSVCNRIRQTCASKVIVFCVTPIVPESFMIVSSINVLVWLFQIVGGFGGRSYVHMFTVNNLVQFIQYLYKYKAFACDSCTLNHNDSCTK